jgi:Spy/CpxP family protein refolding chaperone
MQRQRLLALALAAAGLLAYHTPATAQAGGQPPASAGADSGRRMFDPVGRLLEQRNELKLTDEQASRLEAIRSQYLEKTRPQMEELRRDREKRAAFRAGMDSTRTEVMAVLTPEQQKQVGEMRKKWRSEWRDGKHGGRHGGRHGHDHDDDDDDDDSKADR